MGFIKYIKQSWEDFTLWTLSNKRKFAFLLLVAVASIVAGCVIFANCQHGWWYANRCKHVELLLCGNFFTTFLSLLFETLFLLILMYVSQMHKYLSAVSYLVLVIGGIYCGAHLASLFVLIGALSVLFLIGYTSISVIILLVPCFCEHNPTEYCKSSCEIWCDGKRAFCAVLFLSVLRILLLFLFLRPICASI